MIADILEKLKPVIGEQADTIWNLYVASDEEGKKELAQYLQILYSQLVETYDRKILFEPPDIGRIAGAFVLGLIIYPDQPYFPLLINEVELNSHCLLVGRTGVGKTTLIYRLLDQIMKRNIPVLIFDFKRDYRHILRQYKNMTVMRWSELRFNPLIPPPGIGQSQWLFVFADIFCQISGVLLGSKGYLLEQLTELQKAEPEPTLTELAAILDEIYISPTRRQAVYLDVIRNRLKTVLITLGKVINSQGFSLPKMLESNVVIELDGLSTEMQDMLVNIMLMQVFCYRIATNQRGKLRHVLVCDEAKRIFDINKEKRPAEGIPAISILASRIREFGEALIVSDQEPSKLAESIKANCECKVVFGLGHGKDAIDMGKSMGMDEQESGYLNRLPVGLAVVQVPRYGRPMLIKTCEIPKIEKSVTDAEVRKLRKNPDFNGRAEESHDGGGEPDFGGCSEQNRPEQATQKNPGDVLPVMETAKRSRTRTEKKLLIDIGVTGGKLRYDAIRDDAYLKLLPL